MSLVIVNRRRRANNDGLFGQQGLGSTSSVIATMIDDATSVNYTVGQMITGPDGNRYVIEIIYLDAHTAQATITCREVHRVATVNIQENVVSQNQIDAGSVNIQNVEAGYKVHPGDKLIFKVKGEIAEYQLDMMRNEISRAFPDISSLVVQNNVDVSVIREEELKYYEGIKGNRFKSGGSRRLGRVLASIGNREKESR